MEEGSAYEAYLVEVDPLDAYEEEGEDQEEGVVHLLSGLIEPTI